MSIIIDTNRLGCINNKDPDAVLVINAIKSKHVVCYGGTILLKEYARNPKFMNLLNSWHQAGRAKSIPNHIVDGEDALVRAMICRSNDTHIIALARVSGARILYTDDGALQHDFKDLKLIRPKGKVYKNRSHHKLLQ